jgi:hypothetical protein
MFFSVHLMLRNTALEYRRLILTALCVLGSVYFFYIYGLWTNFGLFFGLYGKVWSVQLIFFFDVILRRDIVMSVLSCICYLVHCLVRVSLSCLGLDCVIFIPSFHLKLWLRLLVTLYMTYVVYLSIFRVLIIYVFILCLL